MVGHAPSCPTIWTLTARRPPGATSASSSAQILLAVRNNCVCAQFGKAASVSVSSTFPSPFIRRRGKRSLEFRLLRAKDLSPVNYKRVAETHGKEVPWDEIVKGYEYEKGKFVVLKDEDFQRVDLEATQTVDIQDFVDLDEIDPM
jgi:Ku70/Ku80 beta-barrel domain